MKNYHFYFYSLKLIILLLLALVSLKIIPLKNKIYVLIDTVFKFSLGIFIIFFFSSNKNIQLNIHDRILIILSGFILILLIDYITVMNVLFHTHIENPYCELNS